MLLSHCSLARLPMTAAMRDTRMSAPSIIVVCVTFACCNGSVNDTIPSGGDNDGNIRRSALDAAGIPTWRRTIEAHARSGAGECGPGQVRVIARVRPAPGIGEP
jgi:hypothetical protein